MGSNASAQRKPPVGGAPKQKPALKNSTLGRSEANGRPYDMGNEPFETELYRPDRQAIPETLASENERTYPATLPEQPGARTVPRVHYEEKEDVRTNRDGMIGDRNDPGRPSGRRHGWMNDRQWQQGDRFMDINDGAYRRLPYGTQIPYDERYYPRMPNRRPYRPVVPHIYPSRALPPQIYPVRPCRAPYVPPYNTQIYRSPVPFVDERYRPAPVCNDSSCDLPQAIQPEQPPPYHAIEPMAYRSNPQEPMSYSIPPVDNSVPFQNDDENGGLTERSRIPEEDAIVESDPDRERIVQSLLDSSIQQINDQRPATKESTREVDDDEYIGANLRFYRNQIRFRPHGEKIDYIHRYWFGNYTLLENTHTYIQWLFPLYESSRVNPDAVPLRAHEVKHISDDEETRHRFVTSYMMMLDFYGFCMSDEETGKIERGANWKNRFENLRRSSYNQTRITRILKSLGELGQSKLQSPFVIALLHEVFETKELSGIPPATIHHWLRAISDDFERDYVFNQFKNGINRLGDERMKLKRKDNTKYYFERRKPLMQKDEQFQFTTRKKPKI